MKKLLLVLLAIALVPAVSFAYDIQSPAITKAFSASVTITGGTQTWNAALKNIVDNTAATTIGWSGVVIGETGYDVADQYIEATIAVTNIVNWRMIIYTNNTNFTGDTSTVAAKGFGLVGVTNTAYGLPLVWRAQDDLATPATPVFSLDRGDGSQGFTDYQWKFVDDKNRTNADTSSAWSDTKDYVRVWDQIGFQWGESADDKGPSADNKIFLYFASDFTQALAQTYATSSLTLDVLQL